MIMKRDTGCGGDAGDAVKLDYCDIWTAEVSRGDAFSRLAAVCDVEKNCLLYSCWGEVKSFERNKYSRASGELQFSLFYILCGVVFMSKDRCFCH